MTTMTTAAAGERLHALDGLRAVAMLLGIVRMPGCLSPPSTCRGRPTMFEPVTDSMRWWA
jgi:hypothetical protein